MKRRTVDHDTSRPSFTSCCALATLALGLFPSMSTTAGSASWERCQHKTLPVTVCRSHQPSLQPRRAALPPEHSTRNTHGNRTSSATFCRVKGLYSRSGLTSQDDTAMFAQRGLWTWPSNHWESHVFMHRNVSFPLLEFTVTFPSSTHHATAVCIFPPCSELIFGCCSPHHEVTPLGLSCLTTIHTHHHHHHHNHHQNRHFFHHPTSGSVIVPAAQTWTRSPCGLGT